MESKPRQTDRIALENSTQVRVHGIQVSEGRNTDLIVQDVESLVLSGDVTCIDCNQASTTEVKYEVRNKGRYMISDYQLRTYVILRTYLVRNFHNHTIMLQFF